MGWLPIHLAPNYQHLLQVTGVAEKDVNAYVGCVAGASLLNDYIRFALEAGLAELNVPQIVPTSKLLVAYGLEEKPPESCCGGGGADHWMYEAALAVVSVRLHGKRAE